MHAILIGSTGLVGENLLSQLLKTTDCLSVVTISRRKSNIEHPKLKQIINNNLFKIFESDEFSIELLKGTHFFCTLGTTIKSAGSKEAFFEIDFNLVLQFAQMAKKANAHLSIISAKGASSTSAIFYNKVKGEMEEAVKLLDLSSLHLFRPSLLKGKRSEYRAAEAVILKFINFISFLLPQKIERILQTDVEILALFILKKSFSPQKLLIVEAEDVFL